MPALAGQPFVPPVEFTRAVGLESFRVLAPLVTLQPRSLPDPACHCPDQALRPSGAQAAHQAAVVPRLALCKLLADHALRPCAVSLAACIFHDDIAVARGAERSIQPGDFPLQAPPLRIDHDRRKERHGGAQPRDRDPDLMHGLGIAGARARVMSPDSCDTVERNHLEWRCDPACPGRVPEATGHDVSWIVCCDEGYSSSLAAASLQALGLHKATDLIGGFQAWRAAGLPVAAPGQPRRPRPPQTCDDQ